MPEEGRLYFKEYIIGKSYQRAHNNYQKEHPYKFIAFVDGKLSTGEATRSIAQRHW